MFFLERTRFWRRRILDRVGHNIMLLPEEMVTRNYLTDSLFNKPFPPGLLDKRASRPVSKPIAMELEEAFRKLFGFPYVVPVAQGRLAEAILGKLLVRNGHVIPGSPLFPTTRTHQEFNGATPVEVPVSHALHHHDPDPFKGNLDLDLLEKTVKDHHAGWIPFICVEPCTNATGGQPVSMENMRGIHRIAKANRIPVYLDATRLIENAFFIQIREPEFRGNSVWEIIQEFCSYADGCTMSATKDYLTPIGGFFATRQHDLYEQSLDVVAGLGSGLAYESKRWLLAALTDQERILQLVRERMDLVRLMHEGLQDSYSLVQPVGGHAVFLDMDDWHVYIPERFYTEGSFLHFLYEEYGIRGAESPPSIKQEELGIRLVRLAVPLIGETRISVQETVNDLLKAAQRKNQIGGLIKLSQPPGLTGPFRARFKPLNREELEAALREAVTPLKEE
ncbi:MAG: beta-eliminating lyase-related protein [Candidatus Omnitrophica bacterium]|nr:beta-eliminating lyase-related protein [Candidatus Omnitrophota bacterium]